MADRPIPTDVEERIHRIESNLLPEPTLQSQEAAPATLAERMALHRVPGVSVAVINESLVEWVRGYGVLEAGRPEVVTPETLFQAASISKPVTAIAILRLVQEGRLDLDEDVNSYLRSWKIPANDSWQPRVTLRHLLCHGGGTTVHGFPGYRGGGDVPSLLQVLNGEPPANTPAIRVNAIPGTQFRYSGGGTSVLQQMLIDVTGKPFAALMRELVLDPLGMRNSTYEQPLPEARRGGAAAGHRTGGGVVAGKWHIYPEQAAAGLWTTPSDLARCATAIQRAKAGTSTLLAKATVDQMLTPQVEGHVGLGFFLDGAGAGLRFSHSGGNEGFICLLVAYAERGQGAIVMANSDLGWDVQDELFRAIAKEYGWLDYLPQRQAIELDPQVYSGYVGQYELKPEVALTITRDDTGLALETTGQAPMPLFLESDTKFFAKAVNAEVTFVKADDGQVTGLTLHQNGQDMPAKRRS